MAALVCNGVYERHPRLRIATIESGSDWVAGLVKSLKKAYGQAPNSFASDPVEQFLSHVWVSPYYEDDLERLRDKIGADHVLFGSDFPHAEGLAEPTDFVYDLKGWSQDDIRLCMRENGLSLTKPRSL
jgi:predicted TIM-barrel fold metal-dependent hydrolase